MTEFGPCATFCYFEIAIRLSLSKQPGILGVRLKTSISRRRDILRNASLQKDKGKLVLVTAMTPTPLGEGKTVVEATRKGAQSHPVYPLGASVEDKI